MQPLSCLSVFWTVSIQMFWPLESYVHVHVPWWSIRSHDRVYSNKLYMEETLKRNMFILQHHKKLRTFHYVVQLLLDFKFPYYNYHDYMLWLLSISTRDLTKTHERSTRIKKTNFFACFTNRIKCYAVFHQKLMSTTYEGTECFVNKKMM